MHFKQHIGLKYAELAYFGLWFTPLREALDAFVENTQRDVTGTITLSLIQGKCFGGEPPVGESRCIARSFRRSPWEIVTIRKMPKDSSAFWVCLRARARRSWQRRKQMSRKSGGGEMKMWSGRFRQPLDPDFERWQRSFDFDRRLLQHELAASSAHAALLKNAGVLTSGELIAILQGLEEIGERAASSPEFLQDDEAEDVHHFVEKQLVALIGETGYKLHSGRSRNEQIATDLRLYVRSRNRRIARRVVGLVGVLLDRAEEAEAGPCPLTRICNGLSRCWWRIGCWLTSKCFCATPSASRIAESA